jgi:regulator of sirC expression with transglutaminase-like and TPR domain
MMSVPFPRDVEFHKLLAGSPNVDLVRLMFEFAGDAYPQLDVGRCLTEIRRLGDEVKEQQGQQKVARSVQRRLSIVSRTLYDIEGFHGNREEYYDPRNSYLNEVLSRRTGIPISLGILYMAVARQVGISMYGVGTPGHFVIGCEADGDPLYIDPFSQGEFLPLPAMRRHLESMAGHPGCLTAEHFRPATDLEIAVRVLRNLKGAYARQDNWAAVVPVQSRLALLLPGALDEKRDLGLIYLRTGRPQPALTLLKQYANHCSADEAEEVRPFLRSAMRLVAELN